MKKKISQSCAALLLGLAIGALSGCVRENIQADFESQPGVFRVDYSFDNVQTMAVAAESAEKKVDDAYFVFYDEADGNYVAHQKATITPGSAGTGSLGLPIPAEIVPGSRYQVLIVGNYEKYKADGKAFDLYMNENENKTYTQMKQEMYSQSLSESRVVTPLPFSGELLGSDGKSVLFTGPAKDAITLGVSVKFSRAVCRIDLRNMAAGKLVMAWAKVCNYRDQGYFFHNDAPKGNGVIRGTSTTPPSSGAWPSGYVRVPDVNEGKQILTGGGLYAYPNIVPYVSQDDKLTTCLMIAGYYQDGVTPNTTKLTYYRANVATDKLSQLLKRNYVYTIVVTGVKKPGDDSEEGAMKQTDKLLTYEVGDDWQDESGNTVTDDKGNFLTISRSNVILDNPAGENAIVKVAVKAGTTWEVAWSKNPDLDPASLGQAFKVEKIDAGSFRITTTAANATPFLRNGQLKVTVAGTDLVMEIGVMQLSSTSDVKMLSVDSRTGTFDCNVPGQGASFSFQVLTGNAGATWAATANNELANIMGKFTSVGAHKGYVEIEIQPNLTALSRTGKLTIKRNPADGVADVVINFVQPPSTFIMSVFPNYGDGKTLIMEGFAPALEQNYNARFNGEANYKRFFVNLARPDQYTFSVKSTFNKNYEAYLSFSTTPTPETPTTANYNKDNTATKNELTGGKNGESFFLRVFSTGPGDATIAGSIIVTAVPDPRIPGLLPQIFSFPVEIRTSCVIGDAKIDTLIVADRNVGVLSKTESPVAFNYTLNPKHPDNRSGDFKGDLLSPSPIYCENHGKLNYSGPDAIGWRLPRKDEALRITRVMFFSKDRAYLVSDSKTADGLYIGCYFPLSGYYNAGTDVTSGYYWTSSYGSTTNFVATFLMTNGSANAESTQGTRDQKNSMRCIKTSK